MAEQPLPRLTPRDRACLTWIGQQYAIRFDQLQQLLYRHTPAADRSKLKPGATALSMDRTYEHIKKWTVLELVEKRIILHGDKLWIWLSRKGLREMDLDFNYSGEPARLPHLFYINQTRLLIEGKRPDDLWTSERQIRRAAPNHTKGETRAHTPDALLTNATNGKITAIEVECNAKTDSELDEDLRELAVTYKSVWYFTVPTTKRQIESKLETFMPEMRKPFILYDVALTPEEGYSK